MMNRIVVMLILAFGHSACPAAIEVGASFEESLEEVGVVDLRMKNTYDQEITGARAWVFLLDAEGKVVGTQATWVVGNDGDGATEDQPVLTPKAEVKRRLSIPTRGAPVRAKVTFSSIILKDGTMPNYQNALEPWDDQQ